MTPFTFIISDHGFDIVDQETLIIEAAGGSVKQVQCKTEEEIIAATREGDALLVQWTPITSGVIEALDRCKLIVRYGIGVDNVDLEAAKTKGIPVCNVPD